MIKSGRPRLDGRPGFKEDFCRVLPMIREGKLNLTLAAREIGISARSLKRYMEQWGHRIG